MLVSGNEVSLSEQGKREREEGGRGGGAPEEMQADEGSRTSSSVRAVRRPTVAGRVPTPHATSCSDCVHSGQPRQSPG